MQVLPNGDYQKDDGTVIKKEDVGRLHLESRKPESEPDKMELQEGACSGPIQLHD